MIRVHVRRKADRANWQLYYVDPLTGEDVTRSSGTSDRLEAERAAAAWQAEIADQGTPATLSWEQFRLRFEDEYLPSKSRKTRLASGSAMNKFEQAIGKPRQLAAIDSAVLSQVAATWRRWGLEETSIHSYLGQLRAAFGWAARVGYLSRPPRFIMPRLPSRSLRGRPLKSAEVRQILRATKEIEPRTWRDWCRFQHGLWLSGLRLGEAVALSWDQGPVRVDLDGGKYPQLRFLAHGHKARRDQLTPITPDFAAWLRRTPPSERSGPVLPLRSSLGERAVVSVKRIGAVLSAIGREAGVHVSESGKHASAHDFRRSFGQRWALRVKPITLKALMRHRSIETTLKYYVDQDADDVAADLWR